MVRAANCTMQLHPQILLHDHGQLHHVTISKLSAPCVKCSTSMCDRWLGVAYVFFSIALIMTLVFIPFVPQALKLAL